MKGKINKHQVTQKIRTMIIKQLCVVLCIISAFSPLIEAIAATTTVNVEQAENKLDLLISTYKGTQWKGTYYGAIECKGFAMLIFDKIFDLGGKTIGTGSVSSNSTNYKLNSLNSTVSCLGTVYNGSLDDYSKLLKKAMPGDFIQMRRRSSGGPHSMIVVEVSGSSLKIFDCNTDGKCTVKVYSQTFSEFKTKNIGFSLYRSKHYDTSNTTPNYSKDTRYPTPFIVYPAQTSGKVPVYDSSLSQYSLSQHYISWDDRCTVNEVYTNGYCKVTYPTSSGSSTYYTKLSYFISGGLTPYNYSPLENTDAYTRSDMEDVLGEVYSTDNCKAVTESGNKLQVIYPITNGYKCGWIYYNDPTVHEHYMEQGYGRTLADGDYYIVNVADPTYFLDIHGTKVPAEEGENVQLYQTDDGIVEECDTWTVTYNNGFYTITQMDTDRALDVYNESDEKGANVQVWHSKNNSAQQWAISNNGDRGYRLQARCSGLSLDIESGVLSNGQNIRQWTGNNTDAQRWLFIPHHPEQSIAEGRYIMVSATDEEYELDIPGDTGIIENNTAVRIWKDSECLSRYNAFDITKLSNGYYKLTNTMSGKVLAAPDDTMSESQIIVRNPNGGATEEWAVTRDGVNGGYTLRVRYSGLAIDITNNEMENGTEVIQYRHKRSDNQTWKLVKAEHAITYHAEGSMMVPEGQIKYYKNPLTITQDTPIKEGYIFCGWSLGEDDYEAEIMPGDVITEDEDLDMYAVWAENSWIILPENLTEIKEEAFCGSAFITVVIPESCKKIGKRAFADCSQLHKVVIPRNTAEIAYDAFEGSASVTLCVYDDSSAYWFAKENSIRYEIIP